MNTPPKVDLLAQLEMPRQANTMIVLMCHGKARATFERHYSEWHKHNCPILLFTPSNDPMPYPFSSYYPDKPRLTFGVASHHDKSAIMRFAFLLNFLSDIDFGQFAIFEYDSFILSERLPDVGTSGLIGTKFDEPDCNTWGSHLFIHPPFIIGKSALRAIVKEAKELNSEIASRAQGFWDRYLGILVERAGRNIAFQPLKWGVDSWSNNTIEEQHIPEVALAVKNGVNWIHGCKSAKAYQAIKEGYSERGRLL